MPTRIVHSNLHRWGNAICSLSTSAITLTIVPRNPRLPLYVNWHIWANGIRIDINRALIAFSILIMGIGLLNLCIASVARQDGTFFCTFL